MSYQGWENYETWAIHLWLSNDEGSYHTVVEMAVEALEAAKEDCPDYMTPTECAAGELAESIKSLVEEGNPLSDDASIYSDILTAGLQSANYREIAGAFLESAEELVE